MSHRVLMTGTTGYIGRHLFSYLLEQGDWQIIEASRSTGCDLSVMGWTRYLPEQKVDVIVHLAQSRRYREFPASALDMFLVNVASTAELLEWARQRGVQRFIFTSTGNVYKQSNTKLTEEAECVSSSAYAATKLSAEHLLQPYASFFEIVIVRPFGVYGPNQDQMLIANMIKRVQTGQEITLANGVGIYLTPLFIDDCVKTLERLAVTPLTSSINVFNLAGDQVLSLAEIVDEIARQLHRQPVVKATDEQPSYFCGDNTRLKKYYDSFTPFSRGLALTLQGISNFD